jgi:DNA mismatch repair ATPase MutS
LVVALGVLFAFHRWARPFTAAATSAIERPARELATVAGLLARLESETVSAPRLRALQGALVRGETAASRRIRTLCRLVEWLQVRQSQLLAIVAWLVCWTEHFTLAIERWRQRSGGDIARWFAALGELEAIAALSAHAFEQPQDVWPELVDGPPTLEATALAHPLLPRDTAVANDVALGGTTVALMISGSNMAGKSTYMRSVGVNVVLAQAGAKVRAAHMRLSVLQVAASIRIEDSLRDGASRFYAEISRLQQVTALAAGSTPVLFLLDEVLHGTNSHDRRVGARAVLGLLLDAGALGMITTHDLALATDVEALAPRVRNVHFCDTLRGDRLVFDHRLREGIVETSNALALMRAVGLRV